MTKTPKKRLSVSLGPLSSPQRKAVPHRFVLDALADVKPTTRAMFGALAVYGGEKIVFILRDRPADPHANGVWLAAPLNLQQGLLAEFPNAGPVNIMGKDISGWRLLSVDSEDFESSALHACELVVKGDLRIGKVPNSKRTAVMEKP